MFRRLFWLGVGAAMGFGGSFWLMRKVREVATKYSLTNVSNGIGSAVRQLGIDLREAAAEGREGMREAEERIRAEVATPRR